MSWRVERFLFEVSKYPFELAKKVREWDGICAVTNIGNEKKAFSIHCTQCGRIRVDLYFLILNIYPLRF